MRGKIPHKRRHDLATARQHERSCRSQADQLEVLDGRPGESRRERQRLLKGG